MKQSGKNSTVFECCWMAATIYISSKGLKLLQIWILIGALYYEFNF